MKKKSYWLSISVFVLILIWTVYYYAMQYTGGFADLKDSIICLWDCRFDMYRIYREKNY